MSFMTVTPTQPELDALKKKNEYYQKGEKLLEIKREQILNSLKKTYDNYLQQHQLIRQRLIEDYKLLQSTYESIGKQKISIIAYFNRLHFNTSFNINYYNKLGIDVPKITLEMNERALPSYSFSDTPILIDILIQHFKKTFAEILRLAEFNSMLYAFADIYNKIERRINALDEIILPKLYANIQTIEEILQDTQQEEFIRMRKIKDFLESFEMEE